MNDATAGLAHQPLDDVMLAMDVVDTLRHREQLVDHELGSEERDQQLMEKLRKIYSAQGIEVTDAILREGVAALKEDRFLYSPPKRGLSRSLARVYVTRARWGRWFLAAVGIAILAFAAYLFLVAAPRNALPQELDKLNLEIKQIAQVDEATERAQQLYSAGQVALSHEDTDRAERALADLRALRTTLEQAYTLQVVNRPGEQSGVWRVPDQNSNARNYYVIVEPVGSGGDVLTVTITSEESGAPKRVSKWGLRVSEQVFQKMVADKQDDGIIQGKKFGVKRAGHLAPDYEYPTDGAAITQW